MSVINFPTISSGIFNPNFYNSDNSDLTIGQADQRYLQLSGGSITGPLTVVSDLVVIDSITADSCAIDDISGDSCTIGNTTIQTTQGLTLQSVTTTQKDLLPNIEGTILYDSTLNKLSFNNGSSWEVVTSL